MQIKFPAERVLASATVDQVRGGSVPLWEVFVWGQPPFDRERTYTIEAKTDTIAAHMSLKIEEKQSILELGDHRARLEKLIEFLEIGF